MPFAKPQHAANVAWAAATLRHARSPSTVAATVAGVQPLLDRCKPKELSILLWSCALHNVGRASRPGDSDARDVARAQATQTNVVQVLSAAWTRFDADPSAFNEQDVSLLLWSHARLRHGSLAAVNWPRMAEWLLAHVGTMEPRQLGMVAWAASRLPDAKEVAPRLFQALEQRALSTLDDFAPLDFANFVHACGRVRYFPSASTLDTLAQQVTVRFDSFLLDELANALWGFAALNHHPGKLVGLVAAKVGTRGVVLAPSHRIVQAKQQTASGWQQKTLAWCFSVFDFKTG